MTQQLQLVTDAPSDEQTNQVAGYEERLKYRQEKEIISVLEPVPCFWTVQYWDRAFNRANSKDKRGDVDTQPKSRKDLSTWLLALQIVIDDVNRANHTRQAGKELDTKQRTLLGTKAGWVDVQEFQEEMAGLAPEADLTLW